MAHHRTRLAAALAAVSLGAASLVGLSPRALAVTAAPRPPVGINPPVSVGADLSDPLALAYWHGSIWFADHNGGPDDQFDGSIGRITSRGYVKNYSLEGPPTSLTVGPDHNLWFGMQDGEVGRMTAQHKIKYFHLSVNFINGGDVEDIAAGPGGVWFDGGSDNGDSPSAAFLGRISTNGKEKVTLWHSKLLFQPRSLVAAGGSMWIVDLGGVNQVPAVVNPTIVKVTNGKAKLKTRSKALDGNDPVITKGPDGALWIADGKVLRLTTTGIWTKYGGSSLRAGKSIIVGPDKKLWFGDYPKVGVISTSGNISFHAGRPGALAFGADRTLWSATESGIEKISTKSNAHRTFAGEIDNPSAIVTGPDKSLWFTNIGNDEIGRFVPGKGAVFYSSAKVSQPTGLVVGPDKGLWFTNTGNNTIGRIGSATHKITSYHGTGINAPWGITVGPDKALWFTNNGNNSIGRITTGGTVSKYAGGADTDAPEGIVTGPDGALWYASNGNDAIDRIDPTTHAVTSYSGIGGPTEMVSAQGYVWSISSDDELYRVSTSGTKAFRQLGNSVEELDALAADKAGRIWFAWQGETNNQTGLRTAGGIGVRADSTKVLYRTTGGVADNETAITQGPGNAMYVTSGFNNTISVVSPRF